MSLYRLWSTITALIALLLTAEYGAAYEILYSPADSILYLQCLSPQPYLFRFRDGGARIERAEQAAPAMIVAFDAIPGHLYAHYDTDPFPNYQSTDYGETWTQFDTFPFGGIWGHNSYMGWCGELPGQSQIYNDPWLFTTNDSWQTYDSIFISRWSEEIHDSVELVMLSYRMGLCYALTFPNDILCVSSDTGRSWAAGSHWGTNDQSRIGAPDELWGRYGYRVQLAMDTGRRQIDTLFMAHPPARPYNWDFLVWPTDHFGEAYVLMYLDWWMEPFTTEIIVYHILEYGSRVDSFYYCLYNWEIPDDATERIVPQEFAFSAYPNPFNTSTQISFSLPVTSRVSLRLYDVLGREVKLFMDDMQTAGEHRVSFDGSGLSSGVYLCRMQAGGFEQTKKIILVR